MKTFLRLQKGPGKSRRRLGGRGAGMAQGHQRFAVSGALLDSDVPFGGDRGQYAQGLRGVSPRQVGEMAEGATVVQVTGRMMLGKRHRLQRERSYDQQQYRKRSQAGGAKFHRHLNYTAVSGKSCGWRLATPLRRAL